MPFIIYSITCTPCKYRTSINRVKLFANSNNEAIEIKNTAFSYQNKQEAESIGEPMPFIYNPDTGKSTQLVGVTNEDLERIRGIS